VIDGGVWLDLGERESYLAAHRDLNLGPAIHPDAVIGEGAIVDGSVVGPGAVIEAGAKVIDSVVWADARIQADADLTRCIVCSGSPVSGRHHNEDL